VLLDDRGGLNRWKLISINQLVSLSSGGKEKKRNMGTVMSLTQSRGWFVGASKDAEEYKRGKYFHQKE